jgi:transcription elongation GreA/GreB family factor
MTDAHDAAQRLREIAVSLGVDSRAGDIRWAAEVMEKIERETLERAAKEAEKYGDDSDGHDYDYVIDETCVRVASRIRALMTEGEKG